MTDAIATDSRAVWVERYRRNARIARAWLDKAIEPERKAVFRAMAERYEALARDLETEPV